MNSYLIQLANNLPQIRRVLAITQKELAEKIYHEKLSVRDVEKIMKSLQKPTKPKKMSDKTLMAIYQDIEENLKQKLSTKALESKYKKASETHNYMKQFFEHYGGVALGILALLVLIAMITPVGNITKTSLQGTVKKFSGSMNSQMDDAMNATASAQNSAPFPGPHRKRTRIDSHSVFFGSQGSCAHAPAPLIP